MSPAPRLDLDRARGASEILSAAFEVYVRFWRPLLAMALAVVVPLDVLIYGLIGGYLDGDAQISVVQALLIAIEPVIVTVPLVTAVYVRAVEAVGRGESPSVREAVRLGVEDFPRAAAPVLIYNALVVLGFVALIVPGVWMLVRGQFTVQSAVVDGRRWYGAVRGPAELVDGTWWRVAGIVLLIGVIGSAASRIIGAPLEALATDADSGPLLLLSRIVADTIGLSFGALASTILFFDLRARRRGAAPRASTPSGLERPERPV